jgi:DnaJ-class molecular chaperone
MSTADCPDCGGQGVVYGARCERCDGTGRVTVEPEPDAAREARRRRGERRRARPEPRAAVV